MPFMVLVLVLVVMALTKWQDKREDERNRAKLG
jgi:hypothetical protein